MMKNKIKSFLCKINFIKRYRELKSENEFLKKQLEIMCNNEIVTVKKKYSIDFVRNRRYFNKYAIDDINGNPTSIASSIVKQYKRDCENDILNYIRPLIKYSRNDNLVGLDEDTIAFEMVCPVLIEKN